MSTRDELAARYAPTLYRGVASTEFEQPQVPVQRAVGGPVAADGRSIGVMIALYPTGDVTAKLALPDGEPPEELHVTLAYLGLVGDTDLATLQGIVAAFAGHTSELEGQVAGLGLFTAGEKPVTYASVDVPGLSLAREILVAALQEAGITVASDHGYTPHITLDYTDRREVTVPNLDLEFDTVSISYGEDRYDYPLLDTDAEDDADETSEKPVRASLQITERTLPPLKLTLPEPQETAKAFVTSLGGHTLITAPASTLVEKAGYANKYMLGMAGRFVGAETANRNGAFWSAGDLELGQATVTNGPLNWLHEARHVIGTITGATFVAGSLDADYVQAADGIPDPHIVATSAIWRWVYPDEAYVVEQASDLGKLWYSMECISETVQCMGDNGCGTEIAYTPYVKGAGCAHMNERSAVRRFKDPTFLGGAVIVPPARPGWGDANASILTEAASLAEAAYDQAGQPDIAASQWEMLMAQVVSYARNV